MRSQHPGSVTQVYCYKALADRPGISRVTAKSGQEER